MISPRLVLIAAIAALSPPGPADGSDGVSSAPAAGAVMIKDFGFSPAALTVSRGTRVTWRNLDGEPHTVASTTGAFRSGALDQQDTFSFEFDEPGTYRYVCTIHPHMSGTITVH
jgi:plastocyanin